MRMANIRKGRADVQVGIHYVGTLVRAPGGWRIEFDYSNVANLSAELGVDWEALMDLPAKRSEVEAELASLRVALCPTRSSAFDAYRCFANTLKDTYLSACNDVRLTAYSLWCEQTKLAIHCDLRSPAELPWCPYPPGAFADNWRDGIEEARSDWFQYAPENQKHWAAGSRTRD